MEVWVGDEKERQKARFQSSCVSCRDRVWLLFFPVGEAESESKSDGRSPSQYQHTRPTLSFRSLRLALARYPCSSELLLKG